MMTSCVRSSISGDNRVNRFCEPDEGSRACLLMVSKVPAIRLPAYRALAAAGIMEPVPVSDTEYQFTEDAMMR
jgi:hypothetical protein